MSNTSASFCTKCGKPLEEGASFCPSCGAAVAASQAVEQGMAAPPPVQPVPPAPPGQAEAAPAYGEGFPPAPPPGVPPQVGVPPQAPVKKSKAPLIIGILGGLLVVGGIVVLILFLTVWKGGGTAGGTNTPKALAEKYMKAMENKDVDAYMDCFDPSYFSMEDNPFMEGMGLDVKKMLEMSFQYIEVRFKGVELEVQSEKGDTAVVVTTAGSLSMSFMGMGEEMDLSDEAMEFEMVKKGGRWYLTEDPLPTGMSLEGGVDEFFDEEMDMEDMEEFLPENLDTQDLMDLLPEDLDLEELEKLLPEGYDLEDLENMDLNDLRRLLEELEPYLEEMLEEYSGSGKPV